jgi:predicted dithiol-disulfide oxidoreductase (DUF899 family)
VFSQEIAMSERVDEIQNQILKLKQELIEAKRALPPEPVQDYQLTRSTGEAVRLSELFGEQDDMILIHNMGRGCRYCTLWADGFVSVLPQIEQRAAFVVSTPDSPDAQASFAASRGWPFTMVSTSASSLPTDLGFESGGSYEPGFSALHRNPDGTIVRTGRDSFGPGDDYAPIWHFFDHLDGGEQGWEPGATVKA